MGLLEPWRRSSAGAKRGEKLGVESTHGKVRKIEISRAVMLAVWAEERNIAAPDALAAIASACGHDGGGLLQAPENDSVQALYDRFSDEAIVADAFGAPWYVVAGEGFWGQDRLGFVERALAK